MAKGVDMVIAVGKPKGKPMDDERAEGGKQDDELSVFGEYADDLFDALKSGNRSAFKEALKNAIHSCQDEY